jgi:hypothetical protein
MSVLRGYSQIPSRASRFVILNDLEDVTIGWTSKDISDGLASAKLDNLIFDYDGTTINAKTLADITSIYGYISGSIGSVNCDINEGAEFLDIGKQLRFTYRGKVVAIWTKVQYVSKKGLPGSLPSIFYIATYNYNFGDTTFDNPLVARLG